MDRRMENLKATFASLQDQLQGKPNDPEIMAEMTKTNEEYLLLQVVKKTTLPQGQLTDISEPSDAAM